MERKCKSSEECQDMNGYCNFDFGDFGFCQTCNMTSEVGCENGGFYLEKGILECKKTCESCKLSSECGDSNGFCNLEYGDNGICESCNSTSVGSWTNMTCANREFVKENGSLECQKTCEKCTSSSDCGDPKIFCNFDYGDYGLCESCNITSEGSLDDMVCADRRFDYENGSLECQKTCEMQEVCRYTDGSLRSMGMIKSVTANVEQNICCEAGTVGGIAELI